MRIAPLARPALAALATAVLLATTQTALAEPRGEFHTVAQRRASDVAGGPLDPALAAADTGGHVVFGTTLEWFDGRRCDDWSIVATAQPVANLDDPLLSDLQVTAARLDDALPDYRRNRHYRLACAGKPFASVAEIDARVLVAPTPDGTAYVVLEKPLDTDAARQVQQALKSTKFHSGLVSGEIDVATRRSLAFFASYLGAEYRFAGSPATQNLLAGLGLSDLAKSAAPR